MHRTKSFQKILWPTLVVMLTLACSFGLGRAPRVENHPQPTLTVETQVFEDAGCPAESGYQRCPPESPLGKLGCDQIRPPGNLLGGLDPAYPLNVCLITRTPDEQPDESEYLYSDGCLLRDYVRYVIWRQGEFRLLKSLADLQQVYAPIESEEEALSYALAATGLGVRYGLEAPRGYRYFVDELEDTHVAATEAGYLVHLYGYRLCGCGPHTTYTVDVLVSRDGQVSQGDRQPVYEDPAEDDLCVD